MKSEETSISLDRNQCSVRYTLIIPYDLLLVGMIPAMGDLRIFYCRHKKILAQKSLKEAIP